MTGNLVEKKFLSIDGYDFNSSSQRAILDTYFASTFFYVDVASDDFLP